MAKRILVVEDDFYILDLYKRNFEQAGYEVEVAVDGREALDKTKDKTFDLILLDIMLPKVTGIDVLIALRDSKSPAKDTPVFIITNLGQEKIINQAFKIGANGFFLKAQITPEDVVKEIDAFFARNR